MVVEDIDVERGETVSVQLISKLFETGPLLQGINKRFDSDGDLFVILFGVRKNGYSQELDIGFEDQSETCFRYIGEGREDHSLETPGNRALRESMSKDIPIFFFLRDDSEKFTYYGKARVIDYSWEQFQDRQVVVFDLELEKTPNSASLSSLVVISGSAI